MNTSQKEELINHLNQVKDSYVELLVGIRKNEARLNEENKALIEELRAKTESVIDLIDRLIKVDITENDTFYKDKATTLVNYIDKIYQRLKGTIGEGNEPG